MAAAALPRRIALPAAACANFEAQLGASRILRYRARGTGCLTRARHGRGQPRAAARLQAQASTYSASRSIVMPVRSTGAQVWRRCSQAKPKQNKSSIASRTSMDRSTSATLNNYNTRMCTCRLQTIHRPKIPSKRLSKFTLSQALLTQSPRSLPCASLFLNAVINVAWPTWIPT